MRRVSLTALLLLAGCGSGIEQRSYDPPVRRETDAGSGVSSATAGDAARPAIRQSAGSAVERTQDEALPLDAGARQAAPRRDAGRVPRGCNDEEHWIHAIDRGGSLLRYDPDQNELTEVGVLSCPSASSPISMAVRRDGIAFVLYADGVLYEVDTEDASCRETAFATLQRGFSSFGMGFVSNTPDSDAETLYIVGNGADELDPSPFGVLDTSTWAIASRGLLSGPAELTGNAKAELWAFVATSSPMVVLELDKQSGTTLRRFDVSSIDRTSSASAWAFAYWGGRYYIFYQGQRDDSTGIYRLTPELEFVEPIREATGYRIVGAGVSTCAPTLLI